MGNQHKASQKTKAQPRRDAHERANKNVSFPEVLCLKPDVLKGRLYPGLSELF